jgi:drug/metabolite transporter (DMT)-like permease
MNDSQRTVSTSTQGLLLGAAGVLIFSLTLPMTKIAMEGGALSAAFAWAGRCVLGAFAGIVFLFWKRYGLPPRKAWLPIAGATFGIVFGWPLANTIALQYTPASHAAVVNSILPLATAVIGAWLNSEKLSKTFWMCAVFGSAIVCGYAWSRSGGFFTSVDLLLLFGVLLGGFGYACGAIATKHVSGPEVISWALMIGLPITAIVTWNTMPGAASVGKSASVVTTKSWLAFAYLGLMSQWIGFFFWYRGLALGGIAKVSQVQLIQLFCTLTFSALLLRESIDLAMIFVAIATVTIVAIGRRK